MHVMIINASPHATNLSNTAKILEFFQRGIVQAGGTVELYHLAGRSQWEDAKKAFFENENVIFALPVFAAIIPGFMMEFLEELSDCSSSVQEKDSKRKISFILQSGFPEACQRRCCENYLKKLPELLHGNFAGILSYGIDMRFIENKEFQSVLDSYEEMGIQFIKHDGNFFFQEAIDFTGPEYITEAQAKKFNRLFNFFCRHLSEGKGCTVSLTHKPYECNHD